MEDVVTDIPPPSRFFPEDLDNFASPSPALPSPFVLLSDRNPRPRPPSWCLCSGLSSSRSSRSPATTSCRLRAIAAATSTPPARAFSWSPSSTRRRRRRGALGGEGADEGHLSPGGTGPGLRPQRELQGAAVGRRFHGVQAGDSGEEGAGSFPALRRVPYYTTGSVAEGVGAALLAECQMRKLKGTLCVAWSGAGEASSPSLSLESLLRDLLPGSRFSADNGVRVSVADSDLYV
ncbi:unnamed protein product [Spirodela intermedia]|uniref:Uncharacterized protein n=1 Tax=Spirodela intermedia TaxID=51605 RepID=A0A7I8J6I8_SPIIN|nr:unnamed protein product [Spirodela intermedia]CAA6665857.1 unnamed protein product [Spirodela intermedia]